MSLPPHLEGVLPVPKDVPRLEAIVILRRFGFTDEQIRHFFSFSERTWYRRLAEIRAVQLGAERLGR